MLTVLKLILGWNKCPKDVPESFENAIKSTCDYIVERERIKREWDEIWKAEREKDRE